MSVPTKISDMTQMSSFCFLIFLSLRKSGYLCCGRPEWQT